MFIFTYKSTFCIGDYWMADEQERLLDEIYDDFLYGNNRDRKNAEDKLIRRSHCRDDKRSWKQYRRNQYRRIATV